MELSGTSAVVTGGARGLGEATARALATAGAKVYAFDLPSSINAATPHPGVEYLPVDITRPEQVQAAVDLITGPLRTVVSCAGVVEWKRIVDADGVVHDLDLFAKVVQINLIGTFNVMAIAGGVIAQTDPDAHGQRGVIINTASISGLDGQVGQAAYGASKAAVIGLTLPAARDLALHGIRVLTIAPGTMWTPMLQEYAAGVRGTDFRAAVSESVPFPKRMGEPEEYAKLAMALIDNDYLNGEVVRIDGARRLP
jgi:NAD(P)-dependent dehydrogenase (short-subunit alcohol dehydrogenase family)